MIIGLLLGLIAPTIIILMPIIGLIISRIKFKNQRRKFGIAILFSTIFGLGGPIIATIISAYGFSYGHKQDSLCLTGVGVFLYFGYLITLIGIPITSFVLYPYKVRFPKILQ
jgi:MFS family permease